MDTKSSRNHGNVSTDKAEETMNANEQKKEIATRARKELARRNLILKLKEEYRKRKEKEKEENEQAL